MSDDLLPLNASKEERVLSAVTARIGDLSVPTASTWDPFTCPANILPWLAWGLSVDQWDSNWSEDQKRQTIAVSMGVHKRKGTIGAIKKAINALSVTIAVIERNQQNGLDPYTFMVEVISGDKPVDFEEVIQWEEIILAVKNVRSHLAGFYVVLQKSFSVYSAAWLQVGDISNVGVPIPTVVDAIDNLREFSNITWQYDVA